MDKLKIFDLFSGIGGFSLGLERTGGFETVGFCEIESYPQQVLKKHWPNVPIFEDIHDVSAESIQQRGITGVDVITAGFPCQPFSAAGKQRGTDDERFLWPELYRVIAEIKPAYIILENVPRLLTIQSGLIFAGILYDLAKSGYDVEWQVISAAAFGAWHKRERLWIIAYPRRQRRHARGNNRQERSIPRHWFWNNQESESKGNRWEPRIGSPRSVFSDTSHKGLDRWQRKQKDDGNLSTEWNESDRSGINEWSQAVPNANSTRLENRVFYPSSKETLRELKRQNSLPGGQWSTEPAVGRVVNGLPNRVDRIKALGNSIVPQIAEFIGNQILKVDG